MKHISSLQSETTRRVYKNNEEKRFWSVFQVCMHDEKVIFEAFPYLQNKKNTFLKHFQVYNIEKHVLEVFSSLQHENKYVFEAFSSLQKQKTRF